MPECAGEKAVEFDGCLILHQKLQEAAIMSLTVGTSIIKYNSANPSIAGPCSASGALLGIICALGALGSPVLLDLLLVAHTNL